MAPSTESSTMVGGLCLLVRTYDSCALRKNGVPAELVFYPSEPYGLQEPRHQLDKMRRAYDWFARYLLGATAAAKTVQ